MKVEFNISTAETIKRNHGLQPEGPVQKLVGRGAGAYDGHGYGNWLRPD